MQLLQDLLGLFKRGIYNKNVSQSDSLPIIKTSRAPLKDVNTSEKNVRPDVELVTVSDLLASLPGGGVTSVTGTAPINSTGGSTPDLSITDATPTAKGAMSAGDKAKLDAIAPGAQPGIVETLTTTGTGAATLVGSNLNVPTPDSYFGSFNGTNIVQVAQESDFPAPVGGEIDLVANTTYVIRGNVSITNLISITADNVALVGSDREKDGLLYTGAAGAGDFITITDVNCEISNLKFSSTNDAAGDVVLRATNFDYTPGVYNGGRGKVLTVINCQFRNCFDVMFIEGFDLVDLQNTLTWYIQATSIGCQFKNVSKLQISSCEYVRWFDETNTSAAGWSGATAYSIGDVVIFGGIFYKALTANTGVIPTTSLGVDWEVSGYATVPMIDLQPNGSGPGFGAINISGSLWHPQQTQDGLKIDNTATIGFGTVSANTGIDVGLSTGVVANFDYDIQSTTIVQANQGIQNGNARGTLSIIGNTSPLNTATTNPQVLTVANVGGGFTNTPTFPVANRVITSVANCSFTYNSKIDANFIVVVTATVEMTGDGFIACRLRNGGTPITHAIGLPEIRQGRAQSFSFSVIGEATLGSVFDVEFEALDTGLSPVARDIIVREFVLNGYQF